MRTFLVALMAITVLLAAGVATAGPNIQSAGKFGIGVQAGYPVEGISANWFMTDNTSLQIGAALWFNGDWTGIGGRVDYLWWMPRLSRWDWGDLGWYWGPGVDVVSMRWDGPGKGDGFVGVGAELAVGIGLQFARVPIDVNLEAVPGMWILGNDGVKLDFHIGSVLSARYYF